jgi:hypothetical protein
MVQQQDIVGTWRLAAYQLHGEGGEVSYPLGRDLAGYLIYTVEGYVSATLMRPGRPTFKGGDLLGGTTEEKVAAADGYIAYCGRYTLGPGTVVHHVELSLFPNWIGGDQERYIKWQDGRLVLSTPPILVGGKRQTAELVWERLR